jgi:signal transduction histidine kinase
MNGRASVWSRPRTPAIAAAALGLVVTLAITLIPSLRFAYRSAPAHLALENVDASIAALVAVLFYGRHQRTRSARDLYICVAFTLLAGSGFALVLLPAVNHHPSVVWTSWVPLVTRLFAGALIALAAANPRRRTDDGGPLWPAFAVGGAVLLAVLLAGALVGEQFPNPLDPTLSPASSHRPVLVGDPALLAAQIAHAALYGFAAVMFAMQSEQTKDELTQWLAAGCALAAFARINYFLFPSLYSQWLYTGDILRTAFYVVLGYGAARELRSYWLLHAEAAVFAERRRIARDLHDGTVQELGYIRSLARQSAQSPLDSTVADRIASAAVRAMAEARHAIAALTLPLDEPLGDVVRRTADEMADRYDVTVSVEATDVGDVSRHLREAVVRIVREAVSNAARHAAASRVDVRLTRGCAEVRDDGRGFDAAGSLNGGFGLQSMRDRADSVGASLEVSSSIGEGTTVTMEWPANGD